MYPSGTQPRIWLCTTPTDMRKSFTGLSAAVKRLLGENPASGEWFVFVNRRGTQIKVLYFDRSGYCIWSKRYLTGCRLPRECHRERQLI